MGQAERQWIVGGMDTQVALQEGRFTDAEAALERTYSTGARALPWSATAMQRLHTYTLLRLRGGLEAFEETARASSPAC